MTIEQAIKKLESCSIVPFMEDDCEAAALAIAALQEKQERDKGCEYCTGDVDMRPALIDSDGEHVYIDGNGKLTLNDLDDVQLCFCPMCGRKLEDGENG